MLKGAGKGQSGFNTDVPAPTAGKLADDKLAVYEQEQFNRKQTERREQMQDLASMFGPGESEAQGDDLYDEPEAEPKSGLGGGGSTRPKETIYASANAYRDMNRTLGNFYEQPKEDPEKEEMRKELEELREMAYNRQTEKRRQTSSWHCWKSPISWRRSICRRIRDSRSPDNRLFLLP